MKNKDLKEKAIDIKGKKYVLVSDRVLYFNETYPNGCIQTKIVDDGNKVIASAKVIPDCDKPERYFTGNSQAIWGDGYINKTSALENAETSAVGRSLAFLSIGVLDSIASVDEIKKAENSPEFKGETIHCEDHDCEVPILKSKAGNWYARCNKGNHFIKLEEVDRSPSDIDKGDEVVKQEEIF
jgi:hypothetical protein